MSHNICFRSIAAKLNLVVLLLFATSFPLCLNDRAAVSIFNNIMLKEAVKGMLNQQNGGSVACRMALPCLKNK